MTWIRRSLFDIAEDLMRANADVIRHGQKLERLSPPPVFHKIKRVTDEKPEIPQNNTK